MEDRQKMEKWLNSWNTGISSMSIFHYMTLGLKTGRPPIDPGDLRRCIQLLEIFPHWVPRMVEMREISLDWQGIADNWQELTNCFYSEYKNGGHCPKTYDLIKMYLENRQ